MSALYTAIAAVVLGLLAYVVMKLVCKRAAEDAFLDVVAAVVLVGVVLGCHTLFQAAVCAGVFMVAYSLVKQLVHRNHVGALLWRVGCMIVGVVLVWLAVKNGVGVR